MSENNIIQSAASAAATATTKKPTMKGYIEQMSGEIKKALPSVITPERFTRIVLSALSRTPALQSCTPQSFLGAMMQAAQLGLEPNTALGQAYLIPFRNHGVMECQFQIGYKGLLDLTYRSGDVTTVQAHTVYEKDEFSYAFGLEPQLKHIPARENRGKPIFFYAVFKTKDGGYGFEVMSIEDVMAHAKKFSKAYTSGPWQTNFEEMAKKTVLKKALKYAPMKSEFAKVISTDETVKTELDKDMYTVPSSYIESEEYTVSEETGEAVPTNTEAPLS